MKLCLTTKFICATLFCLLFTGLTARAADGDLKLEAQLIQGSNDSQPKGKAVSPEIEKKLQRLPLKWAHYSVISTQQFTVASGASKQVALGKSEIVVKNLGGERVECTLVGHGKITQSLRPGQTIVTGSNDENSIIVLWQLN